MPKKTYTIYWLEYYLREPVNKTVKTREMELTDKHIHGAKPTPQQWGFLLPELYIDVRNLCAQKKVTYPGDASVNAGREEKVRTKHG